MVTVFRIWFYSTCSLFLSVIAIELRMSGDLYYPDYLKLSQILSAQELESEKAGKPAHDEMLFVITHQAYELWFKQILFELNSVIDIFSGEKVDDKQMGVAIARLERIHVIQRLLILQIEVIETMTPLDFLEFRDLLVPASGFQSLQFKEIEIALGLKREQRIEADQEFFYTRLRDRDREDLDKFENRPTLLELIDRWLQRMPFLEFKDFRFWEEYKEAVEKMLESDLKIVETSPSLSPRERKVQLDSLNATRARFETLLDEEKFEQLRENGDFRLSWRSTLAALFIHLYRDEPLVHLPFLLLTSLVEIDEMFTNWRSRHALMVQRMLGTKIGTGGSSGHDYLSATTQRNRVFIDLFTISTFLISRSERPELPAELKQALGFYFAGQHD